jgi:metal-dependent amidase/aminoacylase/carboxypeptidase family protein
MNVIPERAELSGTVRALDPALRQTLPARIERVIAGLCAALRCEYTLNYHFGTPVTVNDAAVMDLVREVGRTFWGAENVVELAEPTMGAEDFAYYLEKVPGAMFRSGTGCPYLLHTPKYDFGDAPLGPGITVMTACAFRFLNTPAA